MAMLTREGFLAAKLAHEVVSLPELGGEVTVRELSAARLMEIQEQQSEGSLKVGAIVAACVGDENGPFSPPIDPADLMEKSAAAFTRITEVALRLNKMTKQSVEEVRGE